jgi:oxygen-dependent protoporphyrinogen oxidase
VLEAEPRVGGRLLSTPRGRYWLNFGGHVLSGPDSATGFLLRSLAVEAEDVPGVLTALAVDHTVLSGSRVETYPFGLPLDLRERAALVRAGAKLRLAVEQYRRTARKRPGETERARRKRILSFKDDHTFSQFLGPLPKRVDAIFRATIRRSSGEPEDVSAGYGIGYFQLVWDRAGGLTRNIVGGSARLPQAIADTLADRVRTDAQVQSVKPDSEGVTVQVRMFDGDQQIRGRFAVLATPADVTERMVSDLPADTRTALAGINYGPYVVGAFLTNETRPMPYDDIYAIATPERSFNMVFNTANLTRSGARQPGGTLMVYSGGQLASDLDEARDEQVADRYTADLIELFPALRGHVEEVHIKRWARGLPHPRPQRSTLQAGLDRPLGRIFLAGDYLGTTYVETAVQTALDASEAIRKLLRAEAAPDER